MKDINKFRAKIFRALSDPVRLEILEILREGERCVCEIIPASGLPQPIVSRHLAILRRAGLVKVKVQGNRRIYSVTDPLIYKLIDSVTADSVNILKQYIVEQVI
ncbi:MAG: metalloregulator ArsR/SmtB family transcription factor [Candidatus Bathyarchaeia archaeon]